MMLIKGLQLVYDGLRLKGPVLHSAHCVQQLIIKMNETVLKCDVGKKPKKLRETAEDHLIVELLNV